ncbi:MAG TPA: ATP-binding SpoIIE family protein phosphatase [Acidimicrobiia bacterium]|jgi:anti-sigma regulatory factor (Ser/Thr protein kinase)
MHVTRTERPARAEALARVAPIRRLHPFTVLVVVVGLAVTACVVVGSWIVHDNNEQRLLDQRGHEAATVAASSVSGLTGLMQAASVSAESGGADGAQFRKFMQPLVDSGRYVSASAWPLGQSDPQPSTLIGTAPALAAQSAASKRAFLTAAAGRTTLSIRDLLGNEPRRLGYAFAVPGAGSVAYIEAALPANRKARIASDSAFADLDYALYVGTQPRESHLLASSSGRGLDASTTASDSVAFGDSHILLVVSPHGELGGGLLAALPWVLGALGVLLTLAAAFVTERLIRRRERAEELSNRLEEVAEENAELYTSQRDVAQQLQRSLMPRSLPHFPGLESAARYEAGVKGTEVGGDWYDVLPIAEDRVVFSVGDVCGRGLAAAVLMASFRYSIRAYALEQPDPATILDKLSAMMETISYENFATVICGTLDTKAGTLTVARAGHPDLLLIDGDGARYLDVPLGPPVGVASSWRYSSSTHVLTDGATLLAYTDGLVERRREHLDIGFERLRVAALTDLPVASLVPHVVDALVDNGDDDVALLGLRWRRLPASGPDPTPRSIDLPSDPGAAQSARRFVSEALRVWEIDDPEQLAELLTDELVSNVVRHVGSPMQLRASRGVGSVRIEVDDESTAPPVLRDPDQLDENGRGILFVETLAANWGIDVHERGKTVWFELPDGNA